MSETNIQDQRTPPPPAPKKLSRAERRERRSSRDAEIDLANGIRLYEAWLRAGFKPNKNYDEWGKFFVQIAKEMRKSAETI